MNPPTCAERLRRLFRSMTSSPHRPPGPHPVEDEEFVTCWSLNLLSAAESAALTEHLSRCPSCREALIGLVRDGVVEAPPAGAAPAMVRVRPSVRRRPWLALVSLAAAAAVVLAAVILWQQRPHGDERPKDDPQADLARAQDDLNQGRRLEALARVEGLLRRPLPPADADRARGLLEQAGAAEAHDALTQGRFEEAEGLVKRLGDDGVRSSHLENLRMQADQRVPAELTLACAGDLTRYGYDLNGLAPPWKDLPIIDKATQRRDDEWKSLLAADPHSVPLLLNYGQFQYNLSRHDQARDCFTRALAEDPRSAAAEVGLGLTSYEKKAYGDALKDFEAALRIDPDFPPAVLNTAICLERLDRAPEARPYWAKARDLVRDTDLRRRIDARLAKNQPKPE